MKDLGPLTCFLGLEVQQSRNGLFLHQHKYVTDLIDLASVQGATPVDTPFCGHSIISQCEATER